MVGASQGTPVKTARRLIENPHVFDWVVVTLSAILLFGAYFTAYAYVFTQGKLLQPASTIGQSTVLAALLGVAVLMFGEFLYSLRAGRPWNQALPDGYVGSLAAVLIFGVAWLVDTQYWTPDIEVSNALGLDALFTPPHLVEIAAAAVIVSGPLRAAARRGETAATFSTLLSAALLLSVITFATQFIHPIIDPWSLKSYEFATTVKVAWVGQNTGVAAILAQALILAGAALLLASGFRLPIGALTFVFLVNGLLVTTTKLHYEWLPVMLVTGVAADAWLFIWSKRRPGSPSASLCAVVALAFTGSYAVEAAVRGTSWDPSLWAGTILATVMMCWLMGRLLRAGLPTIVAPVEVPPPAQPIEVKADGPKWSRDPKNPIREMLVKAALNDLGTPEALARNPIATLPGVARDGESAAANLRAVLIDIIKEIAVASDPRDAEAGKVLDDYYVRKVGSHEVVMERLHLTRPTLYRRLDRGFERIADKLDALRDFTEAR